MHWYLTVNQTVTQVAAALATIAVWELGKKLGRKRKGAGK